MAQWVKNLPAMQETRYTRVSTPDQENRLQKEMAIHSYIFTWEIPWTEESGGLLHGAAKSQTRLIMQHAHIILLFMIHLLV